MNEPADRRPIQTLRSGVVQRVHERAVKSYASLHVERGRGVDVGTGELRVTVLDVVSVTSQSRTVDIGSLQQKAMLTLLVANKGRSVSLDAIADELWPDFRPQRWRGCLATLASSLRSAAGDREFIFSTARGYTLHRRPEVVWTDVEELHGCLHRAQHAERDRQSPVAEAEARRALAIYGTGPWTTDLWGWNEAAAEAARILGTALLGRGAHLTCINELSRAIDDFDWHDGLWACLIYAHHSLGSSRRGRELLNRAELALGGVTPALQKIDALFSEPTSLDDRLALVGSM